MQLEEQVELAKNGNKQALEKVIEGIQDKVFGLSLRMLYNPADAEDAAQEILIKIITSLNSFRGESLFTTWVYRIAANYLLRCRQTEKKYSSTFVKYEESLELEKCARWDDAELTSGNKIFYDEIRISCLMGMLQCLSRELRIAYLLVDIFEVRSCEGAKILDVTPEVFRKRLSRARAKLKDFVLKNCSEAKPGNTCKCGYHTAAQIGTDRFEGNNMLFTRLNRKGIIEHDTAAMVDEMDELNRVGLLFRNNPDAKAPDKYIQDIRKLINSGKYEYFKN